MTSFPVILDPELGRLPSPSPTLVRKTGGKGGRYEADRKGDARSLERSVRSVEREKRKEGTKRGEARRGENWSVEKRG